MTPIQRLREVLAKRTPGPWRNEVISKTEYCYIVSGPLRWFESPEENVVAPVFYDYEEAGVREPDAAAICAAVNVSDALIAVAEASKQLLIEDPDFKPAHRPSHLIELHRALANLDRAIEEALG